MSQNRKVFLSDLQEERNDAMTNGTAQNNQPKFYLTARIGKKREIGSLPPEEIFQGIRSLCSREKNVHFSSY